jgi:endonuclease YncB( thermonuclease family)
MGVGVLLAACLCGAGPAMAAAGGRVWDGRVTHVTDGDTLWVRPVHGGRPRKLRLLGLDAPELCQPYGGQARAQLAQQVDGRMVRVRPGRHDAYGRLLAQVAWQGRDIGRWLVRHGHAWAGRDRGRPVGRYAALERQARAAHAGLWRAPAESPRRFRQRHGPCS